MTFDTSPGPPIGPRIAADADEWISGAIDAAVASTFFSRPDGDELSEGAWLSIGVPTVTFDPEVFLPGSSERWRSSWQIDILIGSGRHQPDPQTAYAGAWAVAQMLLDDIVANGSPIIAETYDCSPAGIEPIEEWNEDPSMQQTVLRFRLTLQQRGWD